MSISGSYLKKRGNSLDLHTTSDTLHKAAVVYKDSAQFHWRNGQFLSFLQLLQLF